ncbi:hypothetical protein Bca52824_035384 [Brassica carinata]|uniref:Uncharacterized protein n=1 Tax=Brassica carinata TaxID=52824 RepID=A0A8X7S310_BRACI|nr:hypothetical protein Bca52824_035384 [Brassica carinata]
MNTTTAGLDKEDDELVKDRHGEAHKYSNDMFEEDKEKLDEEDDELVKDGHRETHEYGDGGSPRERR